MGKIRVKTLGDESAEQELRKKIKEKREAKKVLPGGKQATRLPGMGGGERTVMVGPSIEELEAQTSDKTDEAAKTPDSGNKTKKAKFIKKKIQSRRYKANISLIDRHKTYPLERAIDILKAFKKPKFDQTVELHVNVKEKGISGQAVLPHGTGKKLRIKVADDALVDQVTRGQIDFDILVAKPEMMSKLARAAKILGPRGLMPNPKNGTISQDPDEAIKKFSAGQITFKTEAAAPIIHLSVGKLSFSEKQLAENIQTILLSIGESRIEKVTLKSTMNPGIRLQVSSKG